MKCLVHTCQVPDLREDIHSDVTVQKREFLPFSMDHTVRHGPPDSYADLNVITWLGPFPLINFRLLSIVIWGPNPWYPDIDMIFEYGPVLS
jgi:hypothetical protein